MDEEVLLVCPPYLMDNRIFSVDGSQRSHEVRLPFIILKEHLARKGLELVTADRSKDISKARAIVFFDVPPKDNGYFRIGRERGIAMHVFVGEPPAVIPQDHDPKAHVPFKRIMTFNDDLIDEERYVRVDYTIPIRAGEKVKIPRMPFSEKRLLCLISSNKFSPHPSELYGERVRAIRFMEKEHPQDFDLYGGGWKKPMIHERWASALKLNGAIWRFWPRALERDWFKTYRGRPPDKSKVLPNYRFTIAYENCITPGFISEKMLEAMLYGCVPVYLGDPNVEKRIPKDCFIDKRDYPDYQSLYERLAGMEEKEHEVYLDNIEGFLNSEKVYPFTIDGFLGSFERLLGL